MSAFDRPTAAEYAPFYASYVDEVPDGPILDLLAAQRESTARRLAAVDEERAMYRYAEGKWSIKEVVGHLADAERIFAYRALTAARGDRTPLPGFEEDEYVERAGFDRHPLAELAADFDRARRATLSLYRTFSAEEAARRGVANGSEVSVRALAWIIAGHERHHVRILGERYGLASRRGAAQ